MDNKPFIFFAFANTVDRYLPNLKKEEQGILELCTRLKHVSGVIDFEYRSQTTAKDFFNIISQTANKITILHYSGHAGSEMFDLDDEAYGIDQLCNLISGLPNLKLVFLNGCSTGEMVDLLLEKGVKAVIATSENINDNKACHFSLRFYETLSIEGKSLRKAFSDAVSTLKNTSLKNEDVFISRSIIIDETKLNQGQIPWGLYYREVDKSILNEPMIGNTINTIDGIKKELRRLLVQQNTQTALELLIEKLDENSSHMTTAYLRLANLNSLERDIAVGIATNIPQQRAQINHALDYIINNLTEEDLK